MNKKSIVLAINLMIFCTVSLLPMAEFGKYFTTAYWLPYTNGNQFELDAQKALKREIKQFNEEKLKKHLKEKDLRTFYTAKIVKAQTRQDKQPFWSGAYWLPYTCGKQLKIDDLVHKRSQIVINE